MKQIEVTEENREQTIQALSEAAAFVLRRRREIQVTQERLRKEERGINSELKKIGEILYDLDMGKPVSITTPHH